MWDEHEKDWPILWWKNIRKTCLADCFSKLFPWNLNKWNVQTIGRRVVTQDGKYMCQEINCFFVLRLLSCLEMSTGTLWSQEPTSSWSSWLTRLSSQTWFVTLSLTGVDIGYCFLWIHLKNLLENLLKSCSSVATIYLETPLSVLKSTLVRRGYCILTSGRSCYSNYSDISW